MQKIDILYTKVVEIHKKSKCDKYVIWYLDVTCLDIQAPISLSLFCLFVFLWHKSLPNMTKYYIIQVRIPSEVWHCILEIFNITLSEVCYSVDTIFPAGNSDTTNDKDSERSFYTKN